MRRRPERLYHATRPANVDSIRAKGLLTSAFGEQYLCESPADCLRFVGLRIASAWTGEVDEHEIPDPDGSLRKSIEQPDEHVYGVFVRDGKVYGRVPRMETNTHAAIVTVDGTKLHAGSLELSDDHVPAFFDYAVSWRYWRNIPPAAILGVDLVPLNSDSEEEAS